jgi:hypothetical protein
MFRMQKKSSYDLSTPWNIAYRLHQSRLKEAKRADNEFSVPFAYMKHHLRVCPNRFFNCPQCRNCVRMAFTHHETLLYQHHQSRILMRSERTLWVFSSIRLLKTSLKRLHPYRFFFRCLKCRKYIRMAVRNIETSRHRLHQSRFFSRPEGRLWVHRAICLRKISIKVAFLDAQVEENEFVWP